MNIDICHIWFKKSEVCSLRGLFLSVLMVKGPNQNVFLSFHIWTPLNFCIWTLQRFKNKQRSVCRLLVILLGLVVLLPAVVGMVFPRSCFTQVFDLCDSVQICRSFADLCRYMQICRIFADLCRYMQIRRKMTL